ncbi:MAG TPA: choice-of-anchor tandem repeat GloVer-containing protein, partial [Verrucomicrobiae bacterium]|nr:choice-of-anchor tandem repeat GloVer-containing protein [Verrucomicrobiae bacterium]
TTMYGGAHDLGVVWQCGTNGAFSLLASFDGTNGSKPLDGLMRGKDGILYGTTMTGGTNLADCGSIFRLGLNGTIAPLAAFNLSNGKRPMAVPTQGADGNLYGTTFFGGDTQFQSAGWGTVFQLTPTGTLKAALDFELGNGGAFYGGVLPASGLVQGPNGGFYAILRDGTGNYSYLFSITPTSGENLTDPARATADDDGDKLSNLLEYALATDLQNPADPQEGLVASTVQQNGTNYAALQFKRRRDAALLQLQYIPEVSADGQAWYADSAHVTEASSQPTYDGYEWVTVIDQTPANGTAPRFLRLRVSWAGQGP